MADQRITQLTALAKGDVAATDVLPIVDIGGSETKKVTAKDLVAAGIDLVDAGEIDLAKLDQTSATKLGTVALADDAVTYAKIQNVSATDKLLGRSTAGAGNVEEIALTAAGRALLDDADAATQRATLGLGTIATQASNTVAITGGTVTGITDLAVADGGTGSSTASGARTNLGVVIGTDVQAFDAGLQSIAGLTTAANKGVYTTASDTYATFDLTAAGRALLDDADAAAQRTTLGLGSLATQTGTVTGTHSGTSSGTNTGDQTITLTGDITGSGTGSFATAITAGAVGASELSSAAVTYAKIQNVSATDRILGRSTAGAGSIEELTCTPAGRALLDDADAAAQRTTLGLGSLATQGAGAVAVTGGNVTGLTTLTSTSSTLGTATITGGTITGITDITVADGGTGSSTASGARTNLGVAIGTDVQAYDAGLQSIAGLTTAVDKGVYTTASDTYATFDLTAAGRTLLADANAAAQRTTLGLGTVATQSASAVAITGGNVTGLTTLGATTSTLGNATITGGTITGITDIIIADGGTGASTASGARTNLGVTIGTDVQAYDAGLQSIAGLTTAANKAIYTTASNTYATTDLSVYGRSLIDDADATTARTTLGLGSLATQSGTVSGTHSGTSSGTNTGDQTIILTGAVTGTGTGSFATTLATDAVTTAKIANGAVTTAEIGAAAVTGPKLAADSSTVVSGNAPSGSGDFEGQQWINTNTGLAYVWTGSTWQQTAAVQTITFTDSTPLSFAVSKPNDFTAAITTTLDTQTAATVFAGPTTGSAAAPTFRTLAATDLPIAGTGVNGAIQPGTGLSVNGSGVLNHTNVAATGTYTKVTVDAQGHVSTGAILAATDIPSLDASKITTGTFNGTFLAANSVSATQLADYGIAQVSESQPVPEFAGQWWINPSDRSAYIWVGTVSPTPNGYWLLVGYGSPTQLNVRFGGTYNATTNTVVTLNQYGTEAGLTVGQALGAPNTQNNGVYLIVTTAGTGTTPAPVASLAVGDFVLSQGTAANWTKIAVVSGATGTFNDYDILSDGTYFTPDMTGVTDVRDALTLLWGRAQIASTVSLGVVLESTEVLVNNTTGLMSIGVVDDGTY